MELMGAQEIRKRLGVSRQRTDQIVARPDFPKPIATLAMGRIWRTADVEKWIAKHRPYLDEDAE
jgi:predicted DNA-binding transcriptional regulator AlpA